jgi:hypothetical protein
MAVTIKIDRGVPPPGRQGVRNIKYPFKLMKVGESFFVPKEETETSNVRTASYYAARTYGMKFNTAIVEEKGVWGIRVWRVK